MEIKNDLYDKERLEASLSRTEKGLTVEVFSSIDSTNAEARRRFTDGCQSPTLFLAEEQTAGRGRLGRSFHSPRAGIYLSLLYPISCGLPSAVGVTCAASVAVTRAIRRTVGAETRIKWVNDLYRNGRKVCGILTEAVTMGERTALIVGIGVNLRPTDFPAALADVAGSLEDSVTPREVVVDAIVTELLPYLRNPDDKGWLEDYRSHSAVLGRQVSFLRDGSTQTGTAVAIDGEGGLVVETDQGETTLRTGEITLRLL